MDGCLGKNKFKFIEKACPKCGNMVELMSTDFVVNCDNCGTSVYSDMFNCIGRCDKARECLGDEKYEELLAQKEKWQEDMKKLLDDDDEW